MEGRERVRWWRSMRGQELLVGYGFVLPNVIGLTLFLGLPILGAFYISFHDWSGIGERVFAGFSNYRSLVGDRFFLDSLRITAVYTFTFVPLLFVSSLALALLVNARLKFSGLFRSAYFLPFMVSLVVASVVWSFILHQRAGILNVLLAQAGISPVPWLGSTRFALWSIVIVTLWQGIGFSMIIFLAGLQDIPRDFHDAAQVDGANSWQRFRWVTFPLLRPTSMFVLIISFINAFQLFDPVFVLTRGGPARATTTAVFYIYETAFRFLDLGYASALSVVLFGIILIFTVLQLRLFRHEPYY